MAFSFISKLPSKALNFLSGGDVEDAKNAQLSPGASDIIQSQYEESQKSPEQIHSEMTQGMDQAQSLSQPIDQSYLGGQTNDMISKALANRSQRYVSDDISRMKNKMRHNVSDVQSKRLGQSSHSLQTQRNLDVENYRRQMERHNAQVAARNQAIASIFQAGGMGAGMMAAKAQSNQESKQYSYNEDRLKSEVV